MGIQKQAINSHRAEELCESRGGRPGLPVLMSLTVSVDVEQHSTNVTITCDISAVSLLESGEQRYVKAINNNITVSRRGQEQGGGAGLSRESRQDQEQGNEAGLLQSVGQSFTSVVPQRLLFRHCDFAPHSC